MKIARLQTDALYVLCRLVGHDASWQYAVSLGLLSHPVCRRCRRDVPE